MGQGPTDSWTVTSPKPGCGTPDSVLRPGSHGDPNSVGTRPQFRDPDSFLLPRNAPAPEGLRRNRERTEDGHDRRGWGSGRDLVRTPDRRRPWGSVRGRTPNRLVRSPGRTRYLPRPQESGYYPARRGSGERDCTPPSPRGRRPRSDPGTGRYAKRYRNGGRARVRGAKRRRDRVSPGHRCPAKGDGQGVGRGRRDGPGVIGTLTNTKRPSKN